MEPQAWELITIAMGAAAALMALAMSLFFVRSDQGIAKAVAMDKLAECINMVVILVFAIAYYNEWFVKMPVWAACSLRLVAIAATTFSSLHLAFQTYRIVSKSE